MGGTNTPLVNSDCLKWVKGTLITVGWVIEHPTVTQTQQRRHVSVLTVLHY